MNKIKMIGVLIFVLSLALALLFNHISTQNRVHTDALSMINEQKSYTQEISKAVFFLSKNRGSSREQLDNYVDKFVSNMTHEKEETSQHAVLVELWEEFHLLVQKFRKQHEITTAYASITTDKLVNDIYRKNQKLILAFNIFLESKHKQYEEKMESYKNTEYILYFVMILLLIYLFTQVHEIIAFIQKFTATSKTIIQKSTIKDLKPMQVHQKDEVLKEASENFNHFVNEIDKSIVYAQESIEHTTVALEEVEQKIEDMMTLIAQMDDEESDTYVQKEDAVIDSLETLMNLKNRLKDLHKDLDKLTSANNLH